VLAAVIDRELDWSALPAPTRFSPDGRWLAYMSIESRRDKIYVTSFPQPTEKWQISQGGGELPRWRRDGQEIFFLGPEGLMSTPVQSTSPATRHS